MVPNGSVEHTFRLRDGRQLGARQVGPDDGVPVLLFAGSPGSRVAFPQAAVEAERHGVRLILVERPGMGVSDFQKGRSLLHWPSDVEQLADRLELETFCVFGVSGGGPHALACAYAMPARVQRAALVSSLTPLNRTALTDDIAADAGKVGGRVLRLPGAPRILFTLLALGMRKQPARAAEGIAKSQAAPDQRFLLSEPGRALLDNMVEGVRQGGRGWAWDSKLITGSWGFEPSTIKTEVFIWHGEEDAAVTPAHAQWLADALPNSHLTVRPGYGHMALAFDGLGEILEGLVRRDPPGVG